ncbi:MAG: type IV toxin-antitoxin system AbiEi family antitoxin, partial [Dehalococcoidia bacterium]|nr:type IV toxin-antitoxin system AbiEi family antitoxin [Dehalococcoidia bacterium]
SVRRRRSKRDVSRPTQQPRSPRVFLDALQASGRYTFTRAEAGRALGISDIALKNAFWRLAKAGRLASPRRGFYVIVPPEYRAAGSLPASWFIRDLMHYLGRPYYVGLLTAASLHGAAHQAPQEFQVVTDRPLGVIEVGRVRIRFVKKAHLARTPTIGVKTPTGEMRVSTPEASVFDLVRYPEHCGGLSNAATVLRELAERLDGTELVRVAEADGEVAYAQRLGYLLELVGRQEVARALAEWVAARTPRVAPLASGQPITGARRDARWRVAVNEEVDVEARA